LGFPGCEIALRIDRDVTAQDGTVILSDTRYFLASINPDQVRADQLLAHARHHWQIENCVFFIKDRWWDEDRHWTRRPGLSEWFAQLTTLATMVLRIFRTDQQPLRAHADYINWNPNLGLEILGLG
jgi:hypothetical protein